MSSAAVVVRRRRGGGTPSSRLDASPPDNTEVNASPSRGSRSTCVPSPPPGGRRGRAPAGGGGVPPPFEGGEGVPPRDVPRRVAWESAVGGGVAPPPPRLEFAAERERERIALVAMIAGDGDNRSERVLRPRLPRPLVQRRRGTLPPPPVLRRPHDL